MSLCYGKRPAVKDDRDLLFANYRTAAVTQAPVGYGHTALVKNPWGMLLNDQLGDCAIAGPAHEYMLWNAAAGKQITFTDQDVLRAYEAITGYTPSNPSSDQGSNVRDVLAYRESTGFTDSTGQVHKIAAYVALTPGDWDELLEALYVFECVGLGIQVPSYAEQQFSDGKPWDVEAGQPQIVGGHYIPVVSRPGAEEVQVVTWGALQGMTERFYRAFSDESYAMLSMEDLNGGKSLEGFDVTALQSDLAAL